MTCVRRTYITYVRTSFPQFSFGKWSMQYYACSTSSNYVCGFQPSNLIQIFIEHRCCFACDKWLSAHVILEETLKSIFYLMNASQFNRRPKICNFLTAVHLFRRACSAMTNSNDISAHKMPSHTRFPNGLFCQIKPSCPLFLQPIIYAKLTLKHALKKFLLAKFKVCWATCLIKKRTLVDRLSYFFVGFCNQWSLGLLLHVDCHDGFLRYH